MATLERIREDGALIIRVEQDGEELLIRAFGELDVSNGETLEVELRGALDGGASAIVLDLSGVTFIDSTGLRVLLLMAKHSLSHGGRLCLLRGSAVVDQAIESNGLEPMLPLAD
jgi:anti-sigma B factor antagonist